MPSIHYAIFLSLALAILSSDVHAAPSLKVSGKVIGGSGYSVLFVEGTGKTRSVKLGASGAFSFKRLSKSALRNATLQLIDPDGQYAGPVVLGARGSDVSVSFSGRTKKASSVAIPLGKVELKTGYASLKRKANARVHTRPNVSATEGRPIGAGEYGLVETTSAGELRAASEPGEDGDRDGIPDAFDTDDDGDLILDASDSDSSGQDVPYTGLFFDFRKTLNAHVRSGLTDEVIDDAIGGENVFSLTFFLSLPSESTVDGGHILCSDSLTYCRPNTPVGYYGGISESSEEFRDRPWSELLNDDGYPRLEQITLSGGERSIVASIQPRVGRDQFRIGDTYEVVLTDGDEESSRRSFALAPFFVSIPALKEYSAGSGTVTVDYSAVTPESGSIPGTSSGDPIVLSSEGVLSLVFWRPQRQAIRSDESGYYDWGNLNYGVVVESLQATCGGFYSGLSSDLTESSDYLGEGDSPFANTGANMYPLVDGQGDRAADINNTLTLSVNLKECLSRAGGSAGVHRVTLTSAGQSVTGGQSAASQTLYVQIP